VAEGYRYLTRHHEALDPFGVLLAGQGLLSVAIVNVPAVATELIRIPAGAAGIKAGSSAASRSESTSSP